MFKSKLFSAFVIIAFCFLTILISSSHVFAVEDTSIKAKRIAVVEFNSDDAKLGKMLSEWTVSVLMERKDCSVIERILLNKVIEEQKLSVSGLANQETTAKIGELYGASHLLVGSLGKLGSKYLLTVKTINVSSAETVESNRASTTDIDNIPEVLASILNGKVSHHDVTDQKPDKSDDNRKSNNVTKQKQANSTGTWEGFFQYDDPSKGYIKGDFTMNIKQDEDGSIYGDINEPWSPGFPRDYEVFRSTISSARFDKVNKRIIFTKKYDLEGYQPIDYVGTLVSDNVITGRWNIGSYTGSWRAIRKAEK